jgi:hypothetical protein
MGSAPVTLLFTDLVNSTELLARVGACPPLGEHLKRSVRTGGRCVRPAAGRACRVDRVTHSIRERVRRIRNQPARMKARKSPSPVTGPTSWSIQL